MKRHDSGQGIRLKDYFGSAEITAQDVERLLDDYYQEKGWDIKTGNPTRDKLVSLNLGYVADALKL